MIEQQAPKNQWHEQLIKQASEKPVSEKLWPQEPAKDEPVEYEWPEAETR